MTSSINLIKSLGTNFEYFRAFGIRSNGNLLASFLTLLRKVSLLVVFIISCVFRTIELIYQKKLTTS